MINLRVKVKLYANLRKYKCALAEDKEIILHERAMVIDVGNKLGIDPPLVMVATVNGEKAEFTKVLKEGDVVALFPAVAGG